MWSISASGMPPPSISSSSVTPLGNTLMTKDTGERVVATRVEVPGYPFMGWVRATLDRSVPRLLRFELQRWNPQPPASSP